MMCSRGATKTIILKSPDSDRVREVIVTSVLLPKSDNNNIRNSVNSLKHSENLGLGVGMEKRTYKRRLDHLSIEEKILRKKLKNREAAQTSRDKKKALLEELESRVVQLQNENEQLHEEVRNLKDDKETLARENARLTEELWRLSVASGASGPAASCPLQKGTRPTHPALPATNLVLRLLTLLTSTLTTGTGSTQKQRLLSSKNLNNSQIHFFVKLLIVKLQKHRKKVWWGRQQRAWNPVGRALVVKRM